MADEADAHALVSAARDVMRVDSDATAGLWPRAAALLARQALERALAQVWGVAAPGLEHASLRCQLLCLGTMLNDHGLGGRVHAAWNTLSGACHHRVYDLPPGVSALNAALATVWDLAEAAEALRHRAGSRH